MSLQIRPCRPEDIPQICEIYNHYIRQTTITFEETPLELPQMASRVATYARQYPWLVGVAGDEIVGYAYATKWKERAAYRHTVESTIYLRDGHGGQGHGRALYQALLAELDELGCHVVLGCIAIPNDASIGLHERLGFRKVAHFNEVGFKHGRWLDVGYWQRTSPRA
ncbi:MAG: GNAT family N-acetyltransferase [Aquabacterium sp.]